MIEFPSHWSNCQLGERIRFEYGKSPNEVRCSDGKYPVYGSSGKTALAINYTTESPAIIVGRKGTIDKPIFLQERCWAIDTTFFADKFPSDDPKYLFFLLDSINLRSLNESTGVPSLSRDALHSIPVSLPPLPEQKKIAEILSRNQKLTLTLKGKLFLLRNLLTAIRNDLFIRHEHNGDLDKRPISDLIISGDLVLIQDGNHGEKHPKASQFINDGIPFVMASHIKEGRFNPDPGKCLSPEIVSGLRIGHSTTGDVLLTHKATIGETCIVPDHCNEIMLSPQVTMYRLNKRSTMTPQFLREWFMTTTFQTEISEMSGQSTRDYIGIKAQQQLHAMVPSNRNIANSITQSITPISDTIKLISEVLIAQDKLQSALSADLLSGRKRVSI